LLHILKFVEPRKSILFMQKIYITAHFVAPCSLLSGATAPLATHPIYDPGYDPFS